jgi:hypothetical protein
MSEQLQVIEMALDQAARRRRWARALRGGWQGLFVGAILCLLTIGAYHLLPLMDKVMPAWTVTAGALAPIACMLVGMIIGGWRKPTRSEVARWVDGKQKLKERLSTALEVAAVPNAGSWRDLIVTDAAGHAKAIDARRMVPFNLPTVTRWAVVMLALGAGLGFVPEYRSPKRKQKEADQQVIKDVGKHLADLTRRELTQRPPAMEAVQKSMESVTELGDALSKKTLTRSDALKELASVTEKLKDDLKEFGKDPAFKKLEQTARSNGGNDSQNLTGLQKQIDSLQKQLGTPTGNPDALDKIKKDLDKLKEAAQSMANQNSPMSDAEKQKMSESLSALSKQMQAMGMQLPQLDDAIEALAANNTDMVLKDIDAATSDLEKMRDMAKSLQQMQAQMEKLGKDLAEQLKNGQPEAAQMTLEKMQQQLKSSNLSQEQLDKMMAEISQAVKPADNYGKVAEHLKQAVQQMKAGDKQEGAKSLAEASKELEKLMQNMGDAKELMATLENMKQATMCVGNCQGWKACKNPGMGNSNGKPGSGVGTWSDSTAEWNGEFNDRWDNSGIVRPDMDAKGHTDRGDGELSDALKPTKVKGQFSPGGQMPSVTLKGVSIKGQSKIAYEEAAAAAQVEAQSALSQDKVPRAYQGAVRDYFDDTKK